MGQNTAIAWCDHTFNPWWGCVKVSPGCANCYAETLSKRWRHDIWGPGKPRRRFGERHWHEPIVWNDRAIQERKRRRVFCGSMCDVFEDHPDAETERPKLWDLIMVTPHLDWLLLTKRPENIAGMVPRSWLTQTLPQHNVWFGVSVESNEHVDRAATLEGVAARIRFVSYEPALGPLDQLDLASIDWVIYGGESGPHHRRDDPQWARDMRYQCRALHIPFFFKQCSGPRPGMNAMLDGEVIQEFPT